MPRVADLAGHPGHIVVAQERQRQELRHELGVAAQRPLQLMEVDLVDGGPDRPPQLILGHRVQARGLHIVDVVAVNHLPDKPGVGKLLPDRRQHRRPKARRHRVRGVQPPTVDATAQPVQHHLTHILLHPRRVVIEGNQVVVALEVVSSDHTAGVIKLRHPILRRRSRSFGQCLRDRREVPACVIEHTVQQQPHTPVPAGHHQGVKIGLITQSRINLEVIDRVVAMAAGSEDRTQQQAVATPRNQVIQPPLQPWQPVHLPLERAQLLLSSQEAQRVDLPPDHMINPRHLATSSLRGHTPPQPQLTHPLRRRQRSRDRAGRRLAEARSRPALLQEMISDSGGRRPEAHPTSSSRDIPKAVRAP